MTNQPQTSHAEEIYRDRLDRFTRELSAQTERWNRIANLRLLFFVAVALLVWGLAQEITILWVLGLALLVVFFVLVPVQSALGRQRRRLEVLCTINDEALKRVGRRWDDLPQRHTIKPEPGHPYAVDLDIFGRASLFQLLETVSTHLGERTLAAWLSAPAPREVVVERQAAVAELAPQIDLREEIQLRGRLMGQPSPDPEPFMAWSEAEAWLALRRWLFWLSVASVAILWLLIIAQSVGLVGYPFWALFAGLNFILTMTIGRQVYAVIARVSAGEQGFRHYADLLELLAGTHFDSPLMKAIQGRLATKGRPAHQQMRRLHNLTLFSLPPSSMLYIVIEALTMWDVFLLAALERWQSDAGKQARTWLQATGEVEALSALASLKHDNPGWAFPQLDPAAASLDASGLGHPLLPEDVRIVNDVTVGPPGTFLLVTGSNMSGKSTLLRSIGVNIVLANAGGPVCATSLRLPPVDLWTVMRVDDSLERGVSYFMAELQRLKQVVDAARFDRSEGGPTLFYLLDEILQGTNTSERQIAARRVIMYLIRQGALGAVSTHDLTLADEGEIASAARMVHFVETILNGSEGPRMTFDYKLRPGIATSTNALRLMQIVGLDV